MDIVTYLLSKKVSEKLIEETVAKIGTDMSYKGSVTTASELPPRGAKGDVYTTSDLGEEYIWNGDSWDKLATHGPKGDKGEKGDKGDKGDPGSKVDFDVGSETETLIITVSD